MGVSCLKIFLKKRYKEILQKHCPNLFPSLASFDNATTVGRIISTVQTFILQQPENQLEILKAEFWHLNYFLGKDPNQAEDHLKKEILWKATKALLDQPKPNKIKISEQISPPDDSKKKPTEEEIHKWHEFRKARLAKQKAMTGQYEFS